VQGQQIAVPVFFLEAPCEKARAFAESPPIANV